MGTIIDLHIHTDVVSTDSHISPKLLADTDTAAGMTGVALTAHMSLWLPTAAARFRSETGLSGF